jgi:predicted signal transduction protein with EAL and GGDEF domain/archaellum component FlaG (FlaF/FlaG flagellin family)
MADATPNPALPWYRQLAAQVAIAVTLLVAAALAAVLVITAQMVSSQSRSRASAEIDAARRAFDSLLENRASAAMTQTLLVTELPIFRAHLTDTRLASDHATIDAMADGYRRQLEADFSIVSDANGRWLASPGWVGRDDPPPAGLSGAIEQARAGTNARAVAGQGNQLFLVVSVPARFADEILGTLTVGYRLTDRLASELARLAQCEVILLSNDRPAATSLDAAGLADMPALVADAAGGAFGVLPDLRRLGDHRYVGGVFPLTRDPNASSVGRLVLLADWEPTQQFIDQLRERVLAGGLLVFAVALVGGVIFSRRLIRPLHDIAAAASDIAAGNLALQLPVRGSAEAISVARAFNDMSTSLRVARERLVHDAIHDHLTHLPNRLLFMERLQRAMNRRKRYPEYIFAVLFIDIDRFKQVNDSLGHAAGDRLLMGFAERLAGAVRRDDTVSRLPATEPEAAPNTLARFGGDEFVVLLDDISEPIDAVRVAERIQRVAARAITVNGHDVFVTPSIGVAVSASSHTSSEDVVRDADLAMHRAKTGGGGGYAVFDAAMHLAAAERLQLETELRRAVERQEFRLWYQPIVSLIDRRVAGYEALIRWQHPTRGLLGPGAFLEVAEDIGVIAQIDEWVLPEACRQAEAWRRTRADGDRLTVSVNLSSKAFGNASLVSVVDGALRQTGLPAGSLRLEVTETAAIADTTQVRGVLAGLRELGVRVSLDDFGTGYCSLSYLQQFQVDTLKIDRSFVSRIGQGDDHAEIIRMIVSLARTLGLEVVAEGTETIEQVEYLASLGCGYAQGYYFAKPTSLESLADLDWAGAQP